MRTKLELWIIIHKYIDEYYFLDSLHRVFFEWDKWIDENL